MTTPHHDYLEAARRVLTPGAFERYAHGDYTDLDDADHDLIQREVEYMTRDRLERQDDGETVPCRLCDTPTRMMGTKLCDSCYELEKRVIDNPALARKVLASLTPATQQSLPAIPTAEQWLGYLAQIRALDPDSADKALVSLRLDVEHYGCTRQLKFKWVAYHGDAGGFTEAADSPEGAIAKVKDHEARARATIADLRARANELEAQLACPEGEKASVV